MKFNVSSEDGEVYSKNGVSVADFVSVYERKTVENQQVLDRVGDAQITMDENGLYADVKFVVDSWSDKLDPKLALQGVKSRHADGASFRVTGIIAS
jgi:hypothetical protein